MFRRPLKTSPSSTEDPNEAILQVTCRRVELMLESFKEHLMSAIDSGKELLFGRKKCEQT